MKRVYKQLPNGKYIGSRTSVKEGDLVILKKKNNTEILEVKKEYRPYVSKCTCCYIEGMCGCPTLAVATHRGPDRKVHKENLNRVICYGSRLYLTPVDLEDI